MFKKLASIVAFISLVVTGFVSLAVPASATGGSDDAKLSVMELYGTSPFQSAQWGGGVSSHSFDPEQYFYDVYSTGGGVKIYLKTDDPDATVKINGGNATNLVPRNSTDRGYESYLFAAVNTGYAINTMVNIEVTAPDGTTKKTYKLAVSSGMLPQPQIISNTLTSSSTAGGTSGVMYVKNFTNCAYVDITYSYKDANGDVQLAHDPIWYNYIGTDANGISKVVLYSNGTASHFRDDKAVADLIVSNNTGSPGYAYGTNSCLGDDMRDWMYAETVLPKALTFFQPEVTSTNLPATVSQFSAFKVSGPGMTNGASFDAYLLNPATGDTLGLNWSLINNNSVLFTVSGYDTADEWKQKQNLQLVISQYDNYWGDKDVWDDNVTIFTKDVKFTPAVASQISVSPAKGPTVGGNKVTITGYGVCNPDRWHSYAEVKIGGVVAPFFQADDCNLFTSSNNKAWDGSSKITVLAPAGPAGQADITIDMGFGPTTLSQKYIYGAKPTVSAIAPKSVAVTGGSIVTITGANFGLSGTPIVIIDGEKSPYVVRVSSSKVLAMVPAHVGTGDVDVDVISSSGGGGLDVPAKLTYAARGTNPVISKITPSSDGVAGGNEAIITGTGFDKVASGVTFNGIPAKITAATTTSLTVEVPGGDAPGAVAVVVGTPTGLATKAAGFTYLADPGITSVSPDAIPSTATVAESKVTITGVGFGTTGKLTIGSAAAVTYTATNGGTRISDVQIPVTAAGTIKLSVLPAGAKKAFTSSVVVSGPVITYAGPETYDPSSPVFGDANPWTYTGWGVATNPTNNGGQAMIIKGSGFGSAGVVKIGTTTITTTSYTENLIKFVSPSNFTAGTYDLSVIPSEGSLTAVQTKSIVVGAQLNTPVILNIASNGTVSNGDDSNYFWPNSSDTDLYTITGNNFLGTDNGVSTKVREQYSSDYSSNMDNWIDLSIVSKTDTSIVVHLSKNLPIHEWQTIQVKTNTAEANTYQAVYYNDVWPDTNSGSSNIDKWSGLCAKDGVSGYTPALIHITDSNGYLGASGTVKLGTTTIAGAGAVVWASNGQSVTIDFDKSTNLATVWGTQILTLTPSGGVYDPVTYEFNCAVDTTVTTKLNNSTADLTYAAGAPAPEPSSAMNNLLAGTSWSEPADNYEYQTKASRLVNGIWGYWAKGLPYAPGEYYVRARVAGATYDSVKYANITPSDVHVFVTGTNIAFTPKLNAGGASLTYKGQLGDGTNGTSNDIGYTASITPADAISSVSYQYRNHACTTLSWAPGLPKNAAVVPVNCGGDGTTVGSWDIRVASFKMVVNGVDQAYKYIPTYNVFNLTINKKDVTLSTVKAEKIYDGTATVTLSDITLTGAIDGENPTLDPTFARGAAFADATAGANKAITLGGPFKLAGVYGTNYQITNPNMVVTGTIKKATAELKLTPSVTALVLGQVSSVDLTLTDLDIKTKHAPISAAGVPDPVLLGKTNSVCTLSGTTVTPVKAGKCIIQATQAASTNYNAAVSYHNAPDAIETVTINIFGTPKDLSIVADDMKVAVGSVLAPSANPTGLIDGDTFDGVTFDYYSGSTKLDSAPTAIGTYKVVPKGGSLTAVSTDAYTGVVKYVAGKLIITPTPPTITSVSPSHGPEAGGDIVVIKGTGFTAVTSITLGGKTIRKPTFTVNAAGTQITFTVPAGTGGLDIALNAGAAEADTLYTYDAPFKPAVDPTPPVDPGTPSGDLTLALKLKLDVGSKLSGQTVGIQGGGLRAFSDYTLEMHSDPVVIYNGTTDANGNFDEQVKLPAKVCLAAGKHSLKLTGITPAGETTSDTAFFSLVDGCVVGAKAKQTADGEWVLDGFLFDYNSAVLTKGGKSSIDALVGFITGAKTVTILGYTETDTKSSVIKKLNLKLAKDRTVSVQDYLKSKGIKAKFVTLGKGGVDPVSTTNQAKNRRVVIKTTY